MTVPRVLTIAGSDPSGGAGLQADLKAFAAWRCYGMAVPTVLTAQDTTGVRAVHAAPPSFIAHSLELLLADCPPAAAKTGMLYSAEIIEVVAAALRSGRGGPVVVDPVMVATSGDPLLRDDARAALVQDLLPIAALVTPNAAEAGVLSGRPVRDEATAWEAAERIAALGPAAVLVKGGHVGGVRVVDVLLTASDRFRFERPRVGAVEPHGAGCTLSAAIAAGLARGLGVADAVGRAGDWVHAALAAAQPVGRGAVPLDHLVPVPGVAP